MQSPPADVVAVADTVVALMRSFSRAKARMLAAAEGNVEWAAQVLLKCVHVDGPKRSGEIADLLQSDPSTVSRQVAALIKDGLLERRADPDDGRASLLHLTERAEQVLADHERVRLEFFARVLKDWSEDDLRHFAALLARFTRDYEQSNTWLTDRIAPTRRITRAGSDS